MFIAIKGVTHIQPAYKLRCSLKIQQDKTGFSFVVGLREFLKNVTLGEY